MRSDGERQLTSLTVIAAQLSFISNSDSGPFVQTEKQEISALFTLTNLESNQPVII